MPEVTIGGGIVGQPAPVPVPAPPVLVVGPPEPVNPIPANIEVVAGGRTLVVDTTALDATGRKYKIRPVDYVQWTIGEKDYGFNWPRYTNVISYSNDKPGEKSENVADTVRFDKRGNACGWGRVTEMNDFCGKGAFVGHEEDMRVMSSVADADAGDNGNRIMHDFIVGGSTDVVDPQREVGVTAYLRTSGANALAYLTYGVWLRAIKGAGVSVTSWIRGGVRMFEGLGTWAVGVDTSQAHITSGEALRMAPGQAISFEPTGQRKLVFKAWTGDGKGDRWQFMNGPLAVLEIDSAGNGWKNGKQVF